MAENVYVQQVDAVFQQQASSSLKFPLRVKVWATNISCIKCLEAMLPWRSLVFSVRHGAMGVGRK